MIDHHPSQQLVAGFAAGRLDGGQHVAVATHLSACADCRALARQAEAIGGEVLSKMAPAAMAGDALDNVLARLDTPAPQPLPMPEAVAGEIPGLPDFVRRYRFGAWRDVAPSLAMRPVLLPEPGPTRVFLLKSRPNTKLVRHSHTGFEMTCVLAGGFVHDGQHFGPGDFDFGDPSTTHDIAIADEGDCISLVAMQGHLRLHGLLGRLLQPFVRL